MIEVVLKYLNNYFVPDDGYKFGTYTIENGMLSLPFLVDGQYFRIVGSKFNDGIYQMPIAGLIDETFDGAIWIMNVPPDVIKLADDVEKWEAKYSNIALSPYASESFGGYQYSKYGSGRVDGRTVNWTDAYRQILNQYRKL